MIICLSLKGFEERINHNWSIENLHGVPCLTNFHPLGQGHKIDMKNLINHEYFLYSSNWMNESPFPFQNRDRMIFCKPNCKEEGTLNMINTVQAQFMFAINIFKIFTLFQFPDPF